MYEVIYERVIRGGGAELADPLVPEGLVPVASNRNGLDWEVEEAEDRVPGIENLIPAYL